MQTVTYTKIMKNQYGFQIDSENDCYIKKDYGAYMGTIPFQNGIPPFDILDMPYYQNLIRKGYNIVKGPPAIEKYTLKKETGIGLYCQNYQEFSTPTQKTKKKKKSQK